MLDVIGYTGYYYADFNLYDIFLSQFDNIYFYTKNNII